MGGVSWYEVELDPATRPFEPFLHHFGMMVFGIIEKNVNPSFMRIQDHDRCQKRDRALGVDGEHLQHPGFPGLKINGSMDVETISAAGLRNGNLGVLWRPAPRGSRRVRRMH